MLWVVLFVVCIVLLYSLSDSKPRAYFVPFWFKKDVQPFTMYAKKYYVVGWVQALSADQRVSLNPTVEIRDTSKLLEDSAVLMAPVPQWNLAQSMRKWEVAADLAREPSSKMVLFVGPTREIVHGVTLGITAIPGVSLHNEEYAMDCIASAVDNLSWRADRRYKYRSKGYSTKEIPRIVWCIGAPQNITNALRKHKHITCVNIEDKDAPCGPCDPAAECSTFAELCRWIRRAIDDTDNLVALCGENQPQLAIFRQYAHGIPDAYYGTPGGPQSYEDIKAYRK